HGLGSAHTQTLRHCRGEAPHPVVDLGIGAADDRVVGFHGDDLLVRVEVDRPLVERRKKQREVVLHVGHDSAPPRGPLLHGPDPCVGRPPRSTTSARECVRNAMGRSVTKDPEAVLETRRDSPTGRRTPRKPVQAPTLSGSSGPSHSGPKPSLQRSSRSVPLGSSAMPVRGRPRSGEWKPIGSPSHGQVESTPVFRVLQSGIPSFADREKQTATREKQTRISVADTPLVPYFFANAAGGNPTAPETRGNPRTGFRIALGREGEGPTDRPSGRTDASELRQ